MTFDVSEAAAPRSDQQNYEDYIAGPKTVTVSEVRQGNAEQPVHVGLVEFPGRPFKPSKTVLRILMTAWGPDASTWAGKRMTLFGDPNVRFGGKAVGGIRVSHLSGIDKPLTLNLTETRGKKALHKVDPLPDAPPPASPITPDQTRELVDAFDAAGITDRAARLTYCQDMAGRELTSASDLTADEAAFAINSLKQVGE